MNGFEPRFDSSLRHIMTEKERKELELQERKESRRKSSKDYFVWFSKPILYWVGDLAKAYKERGVFPVLPVSVLPAYYTRTCDKEVAAFAAISVKEDGDAMHNTLIMRNDITGEPWEWFTQRGFVMMSTAGNSFERTAAKILDDVWCEWDADGRPDTLAFLHTHGLVRLGIDDIDYKLSLLRLVLSTSDGLGQGVWSDAFPDPLCPVTRETNRLLDVMWPNHRVYGSLDDCLQWFELSHDYDFYYAALGYAELLVRNKKACKAFETMYKRWYDKGFKPYPYRMRQVMPPIVF